MAELDEVGSADEREQIRARLEQLSDYLAAGTGKGGRRRMVPNEHEHARQAVAQAVKRACSEIGVHLPGLHVHLRESLRMGHRCCYQPQPPRRWDIIL